MAAPDPGRAGRDASGNLGGADCSESICRGLTQNPHQGPPQLAAEAGKMLLDQDPGFEASAHADGHNRSGTPNWILSLTELVELLRWRSGPMQRFTRELEETNQKSQLLAASPLSLQNHLQSQVGELKTFGQGRRIQVKRDQQKTAQFLMSEAL